MKEHIIITAGGMHTDTGDPYEGESDPVNTEADPAGEKSRMNFNDEKKNRSSRYEPAIRDRRDNCFQLSNLFIESIII